jgi:hypothetical protein
MSGKTGVDAGVAIIAEEIWMRLCVNAYLTPKDFSPE